MHLIRLSPSERNLALEWLRKSPPKDKALHFALELALFDRAAWDVYFDRFTTRAEIDDAVANSMIPLLRAMPAPLVEHLHQRIRPIYDKLSRLNQRRLHFPPLFELRLAPKRAVDVVIQHTLRPDEALARHVASGGDPLAGIDIYFGQIRDKFLDPEGGRGHYSAADMKAVAEAIQKRLKERAAELGIEDPVLTIAGSFPNGRASKPYSDLDTMVSDPRLKALLPELTEAASEALQGRHPGAKLVLEAMRDSTTAPFAAQINPGFLRITPQGVEYLMYPPIVPHFRDKAMLAYNYPSPTAYLLSGTPHTPKVLLPLPPISDPVGTLVRYGSTGYPEWPQGSRWLTAPQTEPHTQQWVTTLANLSESPRKRAQAAINAAPPRDPSVARVLNLALYDRRAWNELLDQWIARPQTNDAVFNSLVPLIERLPPSLRDELVAKAVAAYPTLSREKKVWGWRQFNIYRFPGKVYAELAPKRSIDIFLAHALQSHHTLAQDIRSGSDPMAAYDRFLTTTKETLFPERPQGGYGSEAVVRVAETIQGQLRRLPVPAEGEAPHEVVISGSFPSGRANLATSDVDVITSSPRFHAHFEAWGAAINQTLHEGPGRTFPEAKLEVHPMLPTTTLVNAAIVSPVAISVTRDSIDLLIYPTFSRKPGDNHYLPQNYPKPLRVPLKDGRHSSLGLVPLRVSA